ncbi:MAG: cyclase family protein [Limnochordia bacterium]|jgi:kynurenine formamidase
MHHWRDLTLPISVDTPVFPGDPPIVCRLVSDYPEASFRLTQWHLGSHSGTHVDAPSHFVPGGLTADQLPLEALIGPARVVDLRHRAPGEEMTVADLEAALPCQRLLLCTGWDQHLGTPQFFTEMPGLSLDAARFARGNGVRLIGTDAPNIHATHCLALHDLLLSSGVVLVEGLVALEEFAGEEVFLVVAPLCLVGSDGAPARVFARRMASS